MLHYLRSGERPIHVNRDQTEQVCWPAKSHTGTNWIHHLVPALQRELRYYGLPTAPTPSPLVFVHLEGCDMSVRGNSSLLFCPCRRTVCSRPGSEERGPRPPSRRPQSGKVPWSHQKRGFLTTRAAESDEPLLTLAPWWRSTDVWATARSGCAAGTAPSVTAGPGPPVPSPGHPRCPSC